MSKYAPLGDYLRKQPMSEVPMSFAEIERVIGLPLPNAQRYPAWWSNNPFNNVMTKVWLEAGFKTERVDVAGKRLVFRRAKPDKGMASPASENRHQARARIRHPLIGALKGLTNIPEGVDLTEPADPHWADIVEKRG